ncbi:MAG TPA: choice-of-anchor Q domain-containing protein, partial [Anaerolineales bacterium]|nr:choice-of-anchor Q domain-containing protein [Anaerolineales bacterium]
MSLTLPWAGGVQPVRAAGVCYVDADVVGGANNGASWSDAYIDLQNALADNACTEIWVAAGTYKPTSGGDRGISFNLKSGVAIYGGFAGTETQRSERDVDANVAILSGDIGTQGDNSDNSYHVVYASGVDNTAILDGFTVKDGNANGAAPNNDGGGMYNTGGSPTLTNLIFSNNSAGDDGGGLFTYNSSPTLTNITFNNNSAYYGGGMENENSSPTLTDVKFDNNNATYGGGMFNWKNSSLTLINVTFNSNRAARGGGIYNQSISSSTTLNNIVFSGNIATDYGGGLFTYNSSPTLTNVTFSGNSATQGGGMLNLTNSAPTLINATFVNNHSTFGGGMYNQSSSPTLTNVTFSDNQAGGGGGGMYNFNSSSPTLTNVTFNSNGNSFGGGIRNTNSSSPLLINVLMVNSTAGNCFNESPINASSHHNLIDDGSCGLSDGVNGNKIGSGYNANLAPLANNGGFTQTHAVQSGSAAIDAGDDAVCAAAPVNGLDQRGMARPQGAACDIGAYEFDSAPSVMSITRADPNPTNAASVNFTATFSEAVTGVDAGDFDLTTTGVTGASITSISGSGATYTVTVNTGTGSGTIRLDVLASSDIKDLANNMLSGLPYTSGQEYTVDRNPTVTSILRADANPTNAASVNFTATFSEDVTDVDAGDFDLTTTGSVSGASIASVSGSGTTYTVTVNTGTGSGTIRLDVLASSDIKDLANNALSGLPYTGGEEYTIDKTAPTVTITRADANPTNAASVDFSVTFSEDVVNVDAGDFDLTTTGVPGASVYGISGSGNAYTVTVDAVLGDGTIRLDVSASSDIKDLAGNDLDGLPYEDGEVYTVDKTAPTVTITRADANPTNAASVDFTVTFSESVTNVDTSDFDLTTSGVTGASVASVSGSGATYTVAVNTGTGNGTIRLDVSASSDIEDLAGNDLDGLPYTSGEEYTIDKTAPTVSITRADANPTNAASVDFTVTFSESVTNV